MTKAIILAAGRGSRMGGLTKDQPKCRTELHGKSLIEWQLSALKSAGLKRIAIVRGYLAESFDFDVTYFENKDWAKTNMVGSLIMAEPWLSKDVCIISYSDIIYSQASVTKLINCKADIAMTYDPNWLHLWSMRFKDPLSDAETFKIHNGRVIEIGGKADSLAEIQGQYMGLLKITPEGWSEIKNCLADSSSEECDKMDMTTLLRTLIERDVYLTGAPIDDAWYEVDSESDLLTYQKLDKLF